MIATPLNMGSGISTFSWTPKADCNCDIPDDYGIISWSLDLNMSNYPDSTLNVNAWFVEDSAEFADGGNGAGIYHDIVRNMTDLGSDLSGTATIKIPPAHDGNDLEVHLVYIMNLPEPITENEPPTTGSEKDDDSLPGFTVSFAVIAIAGAAIFTRRE